MKRILALVALLVLDCVGQRPSVGVVRVSAIGVTRRGDMETRSLTKGSQKRIGESSSVRNTPTSRVRNRHRRLVATRRPVTIIAPRPVEAEMPTARPTGLWLAPLPDQLPTFPVFERPRLTADEVLTGTQNVMWRAMIEIMGAAMRRRNEDPYMCLVPRRSQDTQRDDGN